MTLPGATKEISQVNSCVYVSQRWTSSAGTVGINASATYLRVRKVVTSQLEVPWLPSPQHTYIKYITQKKGEFMFAGLA